MTREIYRHSSGRLRVVRLDEPMLLLPDGNEGCFRAAFRHAYRVERFHWLFWRTVSGGHRSRHEAIRLCRLLGDALPPR